MARIPVSPHPIECAHRHYLVYDRIYDSYRDVVEEDVIYGLVKIPIADAFMGDIKFYNDTTGKIDLFIREYSQAEWDTMPAFALFPIMSVFKVTREFFQDEQTLQSWTETISKVRFNDH